MADIRHRQRIQFICHRDVGRIRRAVVGQQQRVHDRIAFVRGGITHALLQAEVQPAYRDIRIVGVITAVSVRLVKRRHFRIVHDRLGQRPGSSIDRSRDHQTEFVTRLKRDPGQCPDAGSGVVGRDGIGAVIADIGHAIHAVEIIRDLDATRRRGAIISHRDGVIDGIPLIGGRVVHHLRHLQINAINRH